MRRNYLGISELGQCCRRVFYAHQPDLAPEISPESARIMELGHLVESLRRREVKNQEGIRIYGPQREVKFFEEAQGHVDGWIKTESGEVELWEAKSTTGYSLSKWRQNCLPRHIAWQIHGYMWGLSRLLNTEVMKTRLDVIDRVSGEAWVWHYQRDDDVLEQARERATFLSRALAEGLLPEREFDADSSFCQRCPFKGHCRPDKVYPDALSETAADASAWDGFQEAIESHLAGQQLEEEGKSIVSRAREALLSELERHQATKARVNGTLVTWSKVESSRFDAKEFQKQHPDLHAAFVSPSSFQRLSISRR